MDCSRHFNWILFSRIPHCSALHNIAIDGTFMIPYKVAETALKEENKIYKMDFLLCHIQFLIVPDLRKRNPLLYHIYITRLHSYCLEFSYMKESNLWCQLFSRTSNQSLAGQRKSGSNFDKRRVIERRILPSF